MDLEVKAGKESKKGQADVTVMATKPKARPVLVAEASKPIRVHWKVTSTATKGEAKDVLIHFFVVTLAEVGQSTVPKLDKDVVSESALTMDFQPKDKASGELEFRIEKPGVYLVRVETRDTASEPGGHDHFAALDLVVK